MVSNCVKILVSNDIYDNDIFIYIFLLDRTETNGRESRVEFVGSVSLNLTAWEETAIGSRSQGQYSFLYLLEA